MTLPRHLTTFQLGHPLAVLYSLSGLLIYPAATYLMWRHHQLYLLTWEGARSSLTLYLGTLIVLWLFERWDRARWF